MCRLSSSLIANATCFVLNTLSSNFPRSSSCSVIVQVDKKNAYQGSPFGKNKISYYGIRYTFHNLPLKTDKTLVVQPSSSANNIRLLCFRAKQAIPDCKGIHVEGSCHLISFSNQIVKHVMTALHFLFASVHNNNKWPSSRCFFQN